MSELIAFDFNTDSVARAYNDVLVPTLFSPWAMRLIDTRGPWHGLRVLDLRGPASLPSYCPPVWEPMGL